MSLDTEPREKEREMLAILRVRRAAKAGATVAALVPDPAKAVTAARVVLGRYADDARISVSRPGVNGAEARCTVILRRWRVTYTAEVER